ILTALETADLSVEKKKKLSMTGFFVGLIGAIVLFFMEVVVVGGIVCALAFGTLIFYFIIQGGDLDNEFRNFVKPLLEYLEEDLKSGVPISVSVQLRGPDDKVFSKGRGPKYQKGVYHKCYDYMFERPVADLNARLFDGNRLMLSVKESFIKTVKTKRSATGKYKTKYAYKKICEHTIKLKLNKERFTCKPLPPEVMRAGACAFEGTQINKQKTSLSQSGDALEMSYSMKFKGTGPNDKAMANNPGVVPFQLVKLYSLLEPVNK
ncbi:MAG: hypothetical protein GY765_19380, partial [bacterium]|nr:hypothetical protein [bacterium]